MRSPLVVAAILLALAAEAALSSGPELSALISSATLESGRDGTITLNLSNTASLTTNLTQLTQDPLLQPDSLPRQFNQSDAVCVVARLESGDERIRVLTGPVYVGAVRAGGIDQVPLEFQVRVGSDAEVGVYPLELILSYSRLSDVQVSGDSAMPEVIFSYDNSSAKIPVAADVVKGPRLSAAVAGSPRPGGGLEIAITNSGDMSCTVERITIPAQPGFLRSVASIGSLDPGASGSFRIRAPDKAGRYPLSLEVSYISGQTRRTENLATIVEVGSGGLLLIGAVLGAALIVSAFLLGARPWEHLSKRGLRRRRW